MTQNGVLVVTGGSRGIGAATALLAARRGYAVVVNYAGNVDAAEAVCTRIRAEGGTAVAVRGDVSDEADVARIFAAADEVGALTGLVNNAGIVAPKARVEDMDAARLSRMFAVNITGSFLCAREAVRRMSTRHGGKGGAIVNLSSAAAVLGGTNIFVDYGASKGAIDTFTVGLAQEVAGDGIRVNAVRPGIIDTDIHADSGDASRAHTMGPQTPMGRAGTADEVAEAVLWLLSEQSSYSTGTIIAVSGGRGLTA